MNTSLHASYRAMQITQPGLLELVERPTVEPGPGEVLIGVEACGVCGADAADIARANPASEPARVPGHEVVGRIVALGANVGAPWKIGQRVGVGRLGGHCNACEQCRQGRFQLCSDQPVLGVSRDGGYAEMMLARATGLVSIPDELASEDAAPILCAGIATFNALKKCGAEAGDLVAVLGVGGLGHMAIQYARRMGFHVVALGRGEDIAGDAIALGAHRYIDCNEAFAAASLQEMGGAAAIISTITHSDAVSAVAGGLASEGRLVLLGVGKDPLSISIGQIVAGQRSIVGSITGTPFESEKALAFSVLANVRPMIEVMPLEEANAALRRLKSGDVRFRIVLTTGRTFA
ncbi:alcohol dehydrogenase catalytic domain-containing protein [Paraburkholderia sp. J11-2]|uniref:alcohol dehydrogenase catalytic domain-containing protein n=1 Tax=Paraburkholderia sp. J11-2 TaxID=2805431 RepID=UPI002AB76DAF|nr:alcohol dehydrogenase catalytic domain-containing protein [Paraburkholderia sp. J11-2]